MFENLLSLFFPPICAGCDTLLRQGELVICIACRHKVPLTNFHLIPENEAFGKLYGRIPVRHVSALCYFHKKGVVQRLIHQLKYRGQEQVGTQLGYWYASVLDCCSSFEKPDVIIPVPLHKRRLNERGYNQVATFAMAIAQVLKAEYNDRTLIRTAYSSSQTRKNLFQRSDQNRNLFELTENVSLSGKHILLVDDVITTGATLERCGKVLNQIPDVKISIVCIAFSHS